MVETESRQLTVASVAGRSVATLVSGLARARQADKPMHPLGVVVEARLRRRGGAGTGAAFLDEPGEDDVLLRLSRSLGLPAPWPDVNGLAMRVPTPRGPHEHADVLFSGTGRGRLTRYALVPSLGEQGPFLGTLLPYRSPTGAVHLGARPLDERSWELVWARPRDAAWSPYGVLELGTEPGRDLDLSFDAVAGGPDGLEVHDWHRRVRGPSYAVARRLRGARSPFEV